MKHEVSVSSLKGSVVPPASKSVAQRAAACALLARGESVLTRYPDSDDAHAALQVIQALGAIVTRNGEEVSIQGGFPHNFQAGIRNPKSVLHCGESGLSSRLFTPVAALHAGPFTLTGEGTLPGRPFDLFESVFPQLGASCRTTDGTLPLKISGPIRGGKIEMDGSVSSQFVTGLLLALPRVQEDSELTVRSLVSSPYIDMTVAVARMFGIAIGQPAPGVFSVRGGQVYQPARLEIPADWSGASFLVVAAAIAGDPYLDIGGLSREIPQADMRIMDALKAAGVRVEQKNGVCRVYRSVIEPFEFDATDCPDLFPPLAALAAFARGVSSIRGVTRLLHKESNRAKVLVEEFGKANIRIAVRDDEMKIYPGYIRPALLHSHADHRIAMAAALLGIGGDKITIQHSQCVSKSYPSFFQDLAALGANVTKR
jgi:3-phosphoshikimate 1-carboxyvinyltransferase